MVQRCKRVKAHHICLRTTKAEKLNHAFVTSMYSEPRSRTAEGLTSLGSLRLRGDPPRSLLCARSAGEFDGCSFGEASRPVACWCSSNPCCAVAPKIGFSKEMVAPDWCRSSIADGVTGWRRRLTTMKTITMILSVTMTAAAVAAIIATLIPLSDWLDAAGTIGEAEDVVVVELGPVLVVVVGGAVAQPAGLQQHNRTPDPYVELQDVVLTAP